MFRPLLWTIPVVLAFPEWMFDPCGFQHVLFPACIVACEWLQATAIRDCKAQDDTVYGDCHIENEEAVCCMHTWETDNTCHETDGCPDYAYGQCRCVEVDEMGIPIVQPM